MHRLGLLCGKLTWSQTMFQAQTKSWTALAFTKRLPV